HPTNPLICTYYFFWFYPHIQQFNLVAYVVSDYVVIVIFTNIIRILTNMEVNETGATNFEQPRITKLIIEKDTDLNAQNSSNKHNFEIKGISILRGDSNRGGYDYYKLKDLSQTRAISITLREKDEEKDVELPEDMLQNMANYLANKNNITGHFDCASFAHAANGIQYESPNYNPSNWIQSEFDGNINPGETVIIEDKDKPNMFNHFAIYLGDDLYISKFGGAGPLIVSDLDAMKKGFDGDSVFKLKPAQKTN
ncbi:MAG: hypothetical protein UU12_C0038G0012, partial [Candidatus Woesebacteria bacterium GW2011_GWA2_40_7b]